jgi:hypothetical protein
MAKRARGTNTRPGQRPRLQRRGPVTPRPSSTVSPPSVTLTPAEETRAAELEAEIVSAERSADRAVPTQRERPARREVEPRVRIGSIAVRASEEYAYVSRDVRRVALIGGSLIAFLIVLWAVLQATGNTIG